MNLEKDTIKTIYINEIYQNWLITPCHFPEFLPEISLDNKISNEDYLESTLNDFDSKLNHLTKKPFIRRKKWRKKFSKMFHDFLRTENILGIYFVLKDRTLEKMENEILEFLSKARNFESELSFTDIGQAVRNYIVFIMFKEMNHISTGFSHACFGYSMLYPFTDNYIDNTGLSASEKEAYNNMIRDKILGKAVNPESSHQIKTCKLLDYIESEYNRSLDTCIYSLLLMMLEAQELSMSKQKRRDLTEKDILHISIYKGGLSVLIDRFLINKELTGEDIFFYLSFGFFLQLADDLLDIKEDIKAGSQTVFTYHASCNQTEQMVNKLFHYVHNLFHSYSALNEDFKNFVLSNCYFLILYGVSENSEFLSPSFQNKLEQYFPVRFSCLTNVNKKLMQYKESNIQNNYKKLLDEILINYNNTLSS